MEYIQGSFLYRNEVRSWETVIQVRRNVGLLICVGAIASLVGHVDGREPELDYVTALLFFSTVVFCSGVGLADTGDPSGVLLLESPGPVLHQCSCSHVRGGLSHRHLELSTQRRHHHDGRAREASHSHLLQ